MRIMYTTYVGIYCQGQNKPSIFSLKGHRMIGKQEHKVPSE